ncbi:MAG: BAX inhibitor protein [Gammaproteobacteria bacterium]|nr:MAG: BAX inhibitor protein [Gammaproteobacteria bacterium]
MQSNMSFQTATRSSSIEINKVLKNTYMLLSMTLAFSAVTAGASMAVGLSHMAALVMMIGAFILMFVVNKKADKASGIFWIFAFTGLMGASLGPMLNVYAAMPNGASLIFQALGGTALIFFALSGYALTSKKDFSFMGGFLMVGLIVVLIAMVANIFFAIPALQLAISAAVIMIMSGLILFDTSRIIHGGETNYIRATVSLYLNIYNIFVHLLSLLGVFGGDD